MFINFSDTENTAHKVKIINLYGTVLKEATVRNTEQAIIELDGMTSGLYILQLVEGNGSFNKQFVISK